ncbi:MAG TPA: nitrophenyl compound nitroreductase subunit ArsF family protein [Bacteroidales bacterium]|nr:nitrophenyl compound nitroreductase subunit ArsF family protein [Bacteroidales bacterium]
MKKIRLLTLIVALSGMFLSCQSQAPKEKDQVQITQNEAINVYYFHFTRRCATCQAVEEQSELALKTLYPELVKSGRILFTSVNLEESSSEELAKKLEVSMQTLLIIKGDKRIDLTEDGFMYARSNPEKLQEKIKTAIDPLI